MSVPINTQVPLVLQLITGALVLLATLQVTDAGHHGHVSLKVYRGPGTGHKKHWGFAHWGYYAKMPEDSSKHGYGGHGHHGHYGRR